ncbi:MAG: hypothetical protein ACLQAT_20620 [Candidatus Binataceae bacterium]
MNGASIRWYEIRSLSTTPTVFQQGTFGPDPKWPWMPSIGMDSAGDIAVGYSVSSPNMNPGIRFTGRTPSDPSGKMEAEKVILRSKGSQTAPIAGAIIAPARSIRRTTARSGTRLSI